MIRCFLVLSCFVSLVSCDRTSIDDTPPPPIAGNESGTDHVGKTEEPLPLPTLYESAFPNFHIQLDSEELRKLRQNRDPNLELTIPVTLDGKSFPEVQLELHGGYSRVLPKKSYRLTFADEDKVPFDFGDGIEHKRRLVFQAAWIDPTYLRQALTFEVVRKLGGMAPRVAFGTLQFNDEPPSFYTIIERVDKQLLRRYKLDVEGSLYKASDHAADWSNKAYAMAGFEQKVNKDNPTTDLTTLLATLHETPVTHEDFVEAVEPVLSLDDLMTFHIAHTYAMNKDTFTKNYYLYHDIHATAGTPEDRFRIISWDADATRGISWEGSRGWATDDLSWHSTRGHRYRERFTPVLFSIPAYKTAYRKRYREALQSLNADTLQDRVRTLASHIRDEARSDLKRWRGLPDFDAEIEGLLAFIQKRHQVMTAVIDREISGLGE